jgi:hypothetical protein
MGFFVVANLGLTMWLSQSMPIDNAGHVGGLVVGFLAGAFLSRELPPERERERRRLLRLPALALALALLFAAAWHTPGVARQRANGGVEVWAAVYGLSDAAASLDRRQTPEALAELRGELERLRQQAGEAPDLVRAPLLEAIDALDRIAASARDGRAPAALLDEFGRRFDALETALGRSE